MIKLEKSLKCSLTKDEWDQRAERSAYLQAELSRQQRDLKDHTTAAKAKIAAVEGEIGLLSQEVRDKAVYRNVECEEVHNIKTKTFEIIRLDTKTVIDSGRLTLEQLQMTLAIKESERERENERDRRASDEKKLNEDGDKGAAELRAKAAKGEKLTLLKTSKPKKTEPEDDGIIDE